MDAPSIPPREAGGECPSSRGATARNKKAHRKMGFSEEWLPGTGSFEFAGSELGACRQAGGPEGRGARMRRAFRRAKPAVSARPHVTQPPETKKAHRKMGFI